MGERKRTKNKTETRLPVDKEKWGVNSNAYALPPEYYYDEVFTCCDCGTEDVWTAKQQKWWYEEAGKNINAYAKRCSICRAHINALKEEQKRHMEEMAKMELHPNETFFKKKHT